MQDVTVQVQKRSDHSVLFDTMFSSSDTRNNVEMNIVDLMGPFSMYQSHTTNIPIPYFNDLSVIINRPLFRGKNGNKSVMELKKQKPE
jgi:hypothetical protein